MSFTTFNQVVAWYEQTKPIVSKHHKAEDNIRPIGQRKRKWERIRKVDPETYLLLDGYYTCSLYNKNAVDKQYEQDMAAIMWKREADGDYIYIRNGAVGQAPILRFQFLIMYLPRAMMFRYNQHGKHWVHAMTPTGHMDFILPKTSYRWDYKLNKVANDDGKRLKFRVNEDGTFTRAGNIFLAVTTTINKELKKEWKEHIEAFYAQAAVLAPMLDTGWNGCSEYRQSIVEWGKENDVNLLMDWGYGSINNIPNTLVRQIVEEAEHPLRVPLMALVISGIDGKRKITSKTDLSSIKSRYNRLMNKVLGMYTTKEV